MTIKFISLFKKLSKKKNYVTFDPSYILEKKKKNTSFFFSSYNLKN